VTSSNPLDRRDYVGLPYEQAREKAAAAGWRVRRLRPDRRYTTEYVSGRLSLSVDSRDVVTEAREG
jgi:hypothetical protein